MGEWIHLMAHGCSLSYTWCPSFPRKITEFAYIPKQELEIGLGGPVLPADLQVQNSAWDLYVNSVQRASLLFSTVPV